jgi:chromosome segregation ATPase
MRRNTSFLRSALVAAGASLFLVTAGHAQAPPTQGEELSPEVRALLEELEETQERLEELQNQALEGSPRLRELQDRMAEVIAEALQEVEPEYESMVERIAELQREGVAAGQAQDLQRYQAIMTEAQAIQLRIEEVQDEVFERPEVSRAVGEFQELLIDEMTRINPTAPLLRNRMEELMTEITALLGDG